MKTKSIVIALFLLTSISLFAVPGPCVQGTLASYIALGTTGCTFEGSVFANFAYPLPPAGTVPSVTPAQILVTPIPGPIIAGFFQGLNFSATWTAGAGELLHAVIAYTVTPPPPASTSAGTITLNLGQVQISGIIGSVNVTQETNVGNLSVFENCTEVCTFKGTDNLSFAPVRPLQVTNVLTLNGGSNGVVLRRFAAKYDLCPTCVQP